MIEYYANFGGSCWWLLVKFGKTNLTEEQSPKNKKRNLLFLAFLTIVVFVLCFN
jgi:hypothetical protein